MGGRPGQRASCTCGDCSKCKANARWRRWWARQSVEKRREVVASRNPVTVRESHRRKQERIRRGEGTAEQKAKLLARKALQQSVRSGRVVRGPCEICGTTESVHAHHDDYSKPLEVRWLCRPHHDELHRSLGQEAV